ncbi:MAG TPA: ion channel [Solirubrobacteraceae bacterium]|nr:ion channel [Solirubrobacteraceae bacterium]
MPIFLFARYARRWRRHKEIALLLVSATIMVLGAALFSLTQRVSIGTALYWAITTATTVGYGDVLPHNTVGRIIASCVMLTTIPLVGAVFAMVAGASVAGHIRRFLEMEDRFPEGPYTAVYGSHPTVSRVLAELVSSDTPVVLVAQSKPPALSDKIHFLAGDPTDEELIRRSDPARADRILIACENDSDTLVIAVSVHTLAPRAELYVLTQSSRVASALNDLGVSHTLASDELVGHTLAKSLETPQAGKVLLAMLDTASYRMLEVAVDPASVSQPLSHARARSQALVLGVCKNGEVELGVSDDPILTADDRLIVLSAGAA